MTQPKPESGWENPDHHPDLAKRPRPMFGPDGKPVAKLPEPEPLTPAEVAMFAAMEAGAPAAQAVATGVIVGEQGMATGGIVKAGNGMALLDGQGRIGCVVSMDPAEAIVRMREGQAARIRELATRALDNPSPASWAVALDEILRELEA
jgi:hypothetical protein